MNTAIVALPSALQDRRPVLVASGLKKAFGTGDAAVLALDGVDLRVPRGQLTAVYGPDGSGKTTLLRVLAGLITPDAGGYEVDGGAASAAAVGYMPQHFGLYDDLTVRENLALYATLYGLDPRGRETRLLEVVAAVGLHRAERRLAGRLSGGMRQKLALGCALLRRQDLLLLDEPTVGVDPLSRQEMWTLIEDQVRRLGAAALVATNLAAEAGRCDAVVCLEGGRVVPWEAPRDAVPPRVAARRRAAGGGDAGTTPAVELHDVVRRFGQFEAVRGVTFSVERGSVVGLLGANGAGKSTVIRMLCGLLPPSSGAVGVAGLDPRTSPAEARGRIGYVSQKFALYGRLTVRQNLDLFATAYRIDPQRRAARIAWALDAFDLGDAAPREAGALPEGTRRRLSLACALLHEPDILILDEPTSGVDTRTRRGLWDLIEELAHGGRTVLISTHDMSEAERCDRVILLEAGEMLAEGPPEDLKRTAAPPGGPPAGMEDAVVALLRRKRHGEGHAPPPPRLESATGGADLPLRRVAALVAKECLQVVRDPSSLVLAFVMPLLLLLAFGFGVSLDPRSVPLAVVTERSDGVSESLVGAFLQSPYFDARVTRDMRSAKQSLARHEVLGIVWIRAKATKDLIGRGDPEVQVILNGADANTARIAESYVHGAISQWNVTWITTMEDRPAPPIFLQPLIWFNRNTLSNLFLVPGLFGIIMALAGTLLSALAAAREWERGTCEGLFTTRATRADMVLQKMVPYVGIGFASSCVTLLLATTVFAIPLRGSLALVLLLIALFLVVSVAFGVVLANRTRNQFAAATLAILGSFMPAFLLSGFIFDLHSMPDWLRYATYAVPARYLLEGLRTLFLVGDVPAVVGTDIYVLAGMGLLLVAMAIRTTTTRVD